MDTISYRTEFPNAQEVEHRWVVIDATDQVLGRLCAKVAKLLRGKYKPSYSPNMECGDNVIIINADKAILTGRKLDQKIYYHHSGYTGGMSETKYRDLMNDKPEFAVRHAITGMLPKGPLGRQMAKKLFVYAGENHPHAAQKPETLELSK